MLYRHMDGLHARCTSGSLDGLCGTWDVEFGASLRGYTVVLSGQVWGSDMGCAVSFFARWPSCEGFFFFAVDLSPNRGSTVRIVEAAVGGGSLGPMGVRSGRGSSRE